MHLSRFRKARLGLWDTKSPWKKGMADTWHEGHHWLLAQSRNSSLAIHSLPHFQTDEPSQPFPHQYSESPPKALAGPGDKTSLPSWTGRRQLELMKELMWFSTLLTCFEELWPDQITFREWKILPHHTWRQAQRGMLEMNQGRPSRTAPLDCRKENPGSRGKGGSEQPSFWRCGTAPSLSCPNPRPRGAGSRPGVHMARRGSAPFPWASHRCVSWYELPGSDHILGRNHPLIYHRGINHKCI